MKTILLRIFTYIFLFCAFFFLDGCKQINKGKDISKSKKTKRSCDSLNLRINKVISKTEDPALLSKQILELYQQAPLECRPFIHKPVFNKLFFTAYANPDANPNILLFFKTQAEENGEYISVKLDALFKQSAYYLYINHQADSGLKSLEEAKEYEPQFNDTLSKSYSTLMAQAMLQKGNLPKAADYYLNAIGASEKIKDSGEIVGNLGNLAVVYSEMGDDAKAIPVKKKVLNYFISKNDEPSMFIGYAGLASSYENLGKTDSALIFYASALDLIKNGISNASVEMILYINLGEIYVNKGDYKQAQYYFDKASIPVKQTGSISQQMTFTIFSSVAYAMREDVSGEIKKIKNYISIFNKENDLVNVRDAWYSLYRIALIKNQDKQALEYFIKYDSVKNILASNNNNKYIGELQTKYDTQKKEVKIQIQQKEIAQKISFINLLLALLLIGGLGTAFIITRNRLKRNKKEAILQQQFTRQLLEKTEEERGRIARDLHDGLSQELLVLKNKIKNGAEIEPVKIDSIINEVRTISRNIHPVMLDQIGFKQSILHICNQLMDSGQLFITADIEYNPVLTKGDELQLFRIIQEALNNIIKYAEAQAAKVNVFEAHNKLITEIQDNGKGFDVTEALNGKSAFGLLSILERSKAINGRATIASTSGGTIIKIEIPINNA